MQPRGSPERYPRRPHRPPPTVQNARAIPSCAPQVRKTHRHSRLAPAGSTPDRSRSRQIEYLNGGIRVHSAACGRNQAKRPLLEMAQSRSGSTSASLRCRHQCRGVRLCTVYDSDCDPDADTDRDSVVLKNPFLFAKDFQVSCSGAAKPNLPQGVVPWLRSAFPFERRQGWRVFRDSWDSRPNISCIR